MIILGICIHSYTSQSIHKPKRIAAIAIAPRITTTRICKIFLNTLFSLCLVSSTMIIVMHRIEITMADFCEQTTRPYVRDLQVKRMEVGHWMQLEARDDTNRYLSELFDRVLAAKSSL